MTEDERLGLLAVRRFIASVSAGCPVCGRRGGREGDLCGRCRRELTPTPLDQVLGAIGWSAQEFAELTGIPERTVLRAASGGRVGKRSARRLAKITGMPAEVFQGE